MEDTATNYKQAFLARTARAREQAGFSQTEMAAALQITQGKYKQYETRSPLPHALVPAFCAVTKVDPAWLFNTPRVKAPRPAAEPAAEPAPRPATRRTRRAAAGE